MSKSVSNWVFLVKVVELKFYCPFSFGFSFSHRLFGSVASLSKPKTFSGLCSLSFGHVAPARWENSSLSFFLASTQNPVSAVNPRLHRVKSALRRNCEQRPNLHTLRKTGRKPLLLAACGQPLSFQRNYSHFQFELVWLQFSGNSSCYAFFCYINAPFTIKYFLPFENTFTGYGTSSCSHIL